MKKAFRIKKNEEFSKLIAQKHSFAFNEYIIYAAKRKEDKARFGISVSKKIGKAYVRNKVKRQLRMMIQEEMKTYPFGDVWDYFCETEGKPVGEDWYEAVKTYEDQVFSARK